MVHDHGGKWYDWDSCMVFCTLPYWLYFNHGECGTVDGFCGTNVINGDDKNYQDILMNNVFHLWGRGPPKVFLVVLSFVWSFNFSFYLKLLVTRDRTKKRGIWGNNVVSANNTGFQIVKTSLIFYKYQN